MTSASGDAAALADLVRQRLDPAQGPLLHVSGADVAGLPAPDGFEVKRVVLYEARQADALPDSARAALAARAIDVATFFSPRAADAFVQLVTAAGLADTCRAVSAIAISPAAAQPLGALPFARTVAAERPTRQAVLDEIDRLPPPGVQSPKEPMTDANPSPGNLDRARPKPRLVDATIVPVRRGLGVAGAFVIGLVAAVIVLAAAVLSLPYWPQEARNLWRGPVAAAPPASPAAPVVDTAQIDAAKREINARLDDLEKKSARAPSDTAAQAGPSDNRPAAPDPAIAELRRKVEALENKPQPEADTSALKADTLGAEIRDRRSARGAAVARPDRRRPEGLGRQGHGSGDGQHRQRAEGARRRARLGGDRRRRPASARRWPRDCPSPPISPCSGRWHAR